MKRMWDKKKLEEMIEEGGSQITVDSALSDTSENPVQNKVIYNALTGKQDSLPDTLEQEGKFLGVDESGNLAWGEIGGKYLHIIRYRDSSHTETRFLFYDVIINTSSTPFTKESYAQYLYDNNYRSISSPKDIQGVPTQMYDSSNPANLGNIIPFDVYSSNGNTSIKIDVGQWYYTLSLVDGVIQQSPVVIGTKAIEIRNIGYLDDFVYKL